MIDEPRQDADDPHETPQERLCRAERAAREDPYGPSEDASLYDGRPTRQEYYERLRRDAELEQARGHAAYYQRSDAPPGGTVWDLAPAPRLEDIHLPQFRAQAIAHGHPDQDPHEGGHLHGTGKPGVSEFPPGWDERKIAETALAVAHNPDTIDWVDPAEEPASRGLYPPYWEARDRVEGMTVTVSVRKSGEITEAWPDDPDPGSGVRYNYDPLHPDCLVSETALEFRDREDQG